MKIILHTVLGREDCAKPLIFAAQDVASVESGHYPHHRPNVQWP